MCGIAGLLSFNGSHPEEVTVRKMTDAMAHRGPDAVGYAQEGELVFGHLRLSIIDLSSAANQPFFDNAGRYVIIFNGEIYNYQEVRQILGNYHFRTNSDTETLVAAYAAWGPDCLRYFRGMFAFAIWDRRDKELFIARDPMGVKPLYYYQDSERLLFASEVRGILASGMVKKKINHLALLEYFSYQSVSFPYSMVEGIQQLEAGSWMRVKEGRMEIRQYWDVTAASFAGSPTNGAGAAGGVSGAGSVDLTDVDSVHKRIRELMLQSIERRLVSDVPVGAFLSGGIDSSAVVGLMAEAGAARPNTFNIAFEEKEYDESGYAELVARKFNTVHSKILLKPTVFLDELKNALDAMDEPSGDGINTYVVSKAIRRSGMTVALSGAGGDELFAGYPFFSHYLRLQARKGLWKVPASVRKALSGWSYVGPSAGRNEKVKQFLQLPSVDIDQVYPIFRQILSPSLLGELTTLVNGHPPVTAVAAALTGKQAELNRLPLLSQVSAAEYLGYTQHTLLKDTDQMSMAVSLEVREPFFDQDLVEFVLAVPDDLKKPVYPKSLLVESLAPLLPEEVVHRRKQGFLFPWRVWLKTELREFGEQHIKNIAERPFIRGGALMDYWNRFLKGDSRTRWAELWLFIVLEYWLEKNGVE